MQGEERGAMRREVQTLVRVRVRVRVRLRLS